MLHYFIVLFFSVIVLLLGYSKFKRRPNKFSYYLSGLILIMLPTLRSVEVGTDSGNYVGMFNYLKFQTESLLNIETSIEIGYLAMQYLALSMSNEYWSLFFIIALISVLSNLFVINKLSENIILSVFIYVSLATYLFLFNGARQAIAASIISVALIYLVEKKLLKYIIVVLIASSFHSTAIIMVPFYFLLNFKYSKINLTIYAIGSFVSLYYLSLFLSVFDSSTFERYIAYEDRNATGGFTLAIFYFINSFVLLILRSKIPKEKLLKYDIFLNMCVFSALVYVVVVLTASDVNFLRISLYFSMGYILIWPIVFKSISFFKIRIFQFAFITIHLLFYYVYLSKMSNLTPYIFNNFV